MDDEDEVELLQNLDESIWTEKDLNALQEGDRLGIGLHYDGFPVVDALDSHIDSPYLSPDDGIQFEIVRQL